MFVRKAFQFRLRPAKEQAKLLQAQLDECRWLYNELLSQRKMAYEELDMSLSKYQQLMFFADPQGRTALLKNSIFSSIAKHCRSLG